jgi:hypothetical protein
MRAFFWNLGEMRGTIDFPAFHPLPPGHGMASEVAEIAATNPSQQIEIDYNARNFTRLLVRVYFV